MKHRKTTSTFSFGELLCVQCYPCGCRCTHYILCNVCLLQSKNASKCSALCTSSGWRKRDYLIFGVALMETQFRSNQSNVRCMCTVVYDARCDMRNIVFIACYLFKMRFRQQPKNSASFEYLWTRARTHICMFRPRIASSICAAASLTDRQFSNLYILWHYAT